jgi:hypothetical protein
LSQITHAGAAMMVTVATRLYDVVCMMSSASGWEREEGVMGIIMICCPATGRDVSTGIEMSDVEQLPIVKAKMVCPACGCQHDWTKSEAWLANSGDQYRAATVH